MENNTDNVLNNQPEDKKPWYKRSSVLWVIAIIGFVILISGGDNQSTQVKSTTSTTPTYNTSNLNANVYKAIETPTPVPVTNTLSNNNYYTNTAGNKVHSPAYSNSVPSGASARCGDGTYSFSQSRRGTCSHHGGVSEWL
ncbi:TPA: hypothetical protein DEP30_04130 [Candidatus Nomurabacteria bacterium]|nr:MAG: hypothetical protein US00_C0009G0007 [Candidatus Nomurabacteria bacterium GW2011_GWF2_36_126]KKP96371.1 MAG: hypothetical protein US04_C0002G0045 [Candidatus Nomurabacteria bacterium GW2011_GWD2_36_14]KKP99113.1 MAG: hypothetical protein US08_C0003G0007 [Candidatus Nomurabacteria bacterium GW2011_GWF2_36_19]KKQ04942.1 MAG: hypothetical protein US17_C0010G0007 [Candidatus Nomurabacteria bacterium GW2011_GWF1_36_47]KKQ08493.1 MAG: hypothetical protein US21_C0014G0018 [Candidatus Nomurabac